MSKKAILVIDMPESCSKCLLFGGYYADMCCKGVNNKGINYPYPEDFRQDWCPLQPMPEKRENHRDMSIYEFGEVDGWNVCIDRILGGKKEC